MKEQCTIYEKSILTKDYRKKKFNKKVFAAIQFTTFKSASNFFKDNPVNKFQGN